MFSGFRFSRPRHFRLLLGSSLALNVLSLALPLMTMQIYDRVLSNRATDTLLVLSIGVLIAASVEFTLRICRSIVVGMNGAAFEHEAATSALSHLLEADPRAHAQVAAATLTQDIGAAARLKDYYGGQMMVTLMVDAPFTLVFLALAGYLAGWLVLAPFAVLSVFLFLSWRHGTKLRGLIGMREKQDNARYGFITQALQVVHTIKSLCLEAILARRFEEVQRESGQVNYDISCMYGQAGTMSYGFAQVMTVAVICAGAPMAIAGHLSVGTLIACVLLSGQVMQPLQRGVSLWVRFQDITLAKKRLKALLALPQRTFVASADLKANHGGLQLEDVRFGYSQRQPVISGTTMSVAPGEAVAITGASGSGKTTLLELMAGIYPADKGRVLIAGMEASNIPLSERTHYVAYLPLGGLIMRGSVMDNLTAFNPRHRSAARQVADQLGIEEAVSLLPSGYDTPLEGNATDVLPPGLKQRISIARALLHKPRLILFDNADHGTDHESYVRIFDLLARLKGKATLVLVSEDRNILSLADHIHELRHGQLVSAMTSTPMIAERRLTRGVAL